MATALVAHLGFRPALAPPGRSCWFAVRQTLCKPALRRLAAQPAAPAPLPPFQPQGQLQGAAPQPAPSAKPFSPTRTAIKLILFAAVGGFIVQPPLPYWVILGQLVCATLMYASVNPGELAAALPALPQPAPSAKRFSKQRFLVKVILGVAVYGYILQAPAPYWFSWAMLICVALMYASLNPRDL